MSNPPFSLFAPFAQVRHLITTHGADSVEAVLNGPPGEKGTTTRDRRLAVRAQVDLLHRLHQNGFIKLERK